MEYNRFKCPVCGESFKNGDDIVVCPECGAPHHRQCYEQEGHCAFYDKHGEDFDFQSYTEQQDASYQADGNKIICPRCQAENPEGMFYCGKCGYPIGYQNNQQGQPFSNYGQNTQQNNTQYQNPRGVPFGFSQAFDPMGGIPSDADLGDGVTAGEASKYVQKNTPYFIRVFNNIRNFSKSRFNFCAFLFSGGYLLYRKMYKLGGIITAIMFLLITAETYITYSPVYADFNNAIEQIASQYQGGMFGSSYTAIINAFFTLDMWKQVVIGLMFFCSFARLVIQIIVGIQANRWYFKHCKKQIIRIKSTDENPHQTLESAGGVNIALAASMYAVYMIITYVPYFMHI